MTPNEQLLNTLMLVFIVLYGLAVAALSGWYIYRHKWRGKSLIYLYVCIAALTVSAFYSSFLFGIFTLPTLITAVIGRLCLILTLTALLVFAIVDT